MPLRTRPIQIFYKIFSKSVINSIKWQQENPSESQSHLICLYVITTITNKQMTILAYKKD